MTIVAIMTVRRAALETFRAFERGAAAVMATHGGRIERTVVVGVIPGDADVLKEIHVVTFPHEQAYAAYRGDERRRALAPLRDESVVHTEVLIGEDGPRYGDPAG